MQSEEHSMIEDDTLRQLLAGSVAMPIIDPVTDEALAARVFSAHQSPVVTVQIEGRDKSGGLVSINMTPRQLARVAGWATGRLAGGAALLHPTADPSCKDILLNAKRLNQSTLPTGGVHLWLAVMQDLVERQQLSVDTRVSLRQAISKTLGILARASESELANLLYSFPSLLEISESSIQDGLVTLPSLVSTLFRDRSFAILKQAIGLTDEICETTLEQLGWD